MANMANQMSNGKRIISIEQSIGRGMSWHTSCEVANLSELKQLLKDKDNVNGVILIAMATFDDGINKREHRSVDGLTEADFAWLTEDVSYEVRYISEA